MKTAREQLDILSAYKELGSYRAATELCGTTHKTVRRAVQRNLQAPTIERAERPKSTDPFSLPADQRCAFHAIRPLSPRWISPWNQWAKTSRIELTSGCVETPSRAIPA